MPHVTPLNSIDALSIIAAHACTASTAGPGACFSNGRGVAARYNADRVCDACLAWAALLDEKGADVP